MANVKPVLFGRIKLNECGDLGEFSEFVEFSELHEGFLIEIQDKLLEIV
jgi:hypothetical protein